jgi:hypothetical protein
MDILTDIQEHKDIRMLCQRWLSRNVDLCRLVILCSMSSRGKTNYVEDTNHHVKEFFVNSWKIEEYYHAIAHQPFLQSVKEVLDASLELDAPPKEFIDSKYFAGGSSRYMFSLPTNVVVGLLDQSVSAVQDILPYIQGTIGDHSNFVVNRLFNIFQDNPFRNRSIVSEYAATQLAMRMGPILIENISQSLKHDLNPAMDGWFLEMWFFASLRKEGVKVYITQEKEEQTWPGSSVINFDPEHTTMEILNRSPIWLKPVKWNQGGYDVVYIDTGKNLVRFVQVTRGTEHSFKIEYFSAFFQKLMEVKDLKVEIKTLEIYFLVPKNVKEFKFKYSQISGQGGLHAFKKGWEKGNEHNQVKVRGIQGLQKPLSDPSR